MKKTLMVCSPLVVSKCLGEAHRRQELFTLHYITFTSFFFSILSKKKFFFLTLIGYPSFAANSLISTSYLQLSFDSSTILHAIILQLAAVIS